MTATTDGHQTERTRDALFGALSNTAARITLGRLVEAAPAPVEIEALAAHLAAVSEDAPARSDEDRALVTLHHHVLPMLADADLVTLGADDTVSTTDHPALSTPSIVDPLTDPDCAKNETFDYVFGALARARRRYVLARLHLGDGHSTAATLAKEIAECETSVDGGDIPQERLERVEVSLRHHHLPSLADLGLVLYEERSGSVAVDELPEPVARWIESEPDVGPRHGLIVDRVVGHADRLAELVR